MSSGRGISLAVAAGASALAVLSVTPMSARAGGRGCAPPGAHIISRGAILRVYTTGAPIRPFRGAIDACLIGRNGQMTLLRANAGFGVSLRVAANSGPLIAYVITRFGVDSGAMTLRVADVSARRVLRELNIGSYVDGGILEREAPTRIVLGPEGAVGWISSVRGPDRHVTYKVDTAATIGGVEKLDEGPDISPFRLTLSGRRLGWWHAGTELHAPLA